MFWLGLVERPHNLLVVINPVGGRKKALHNFKKKVAPLFNRAHIQTKQMQVWFLFFFYIYIPNLTILIDIALLIIVYEWFI